MSQTIQNQIDRPAIHIPSEDGIARIAAYANWRNYPDSYGSPYSADSVRIQAIRASEGRDSDWSTLYRGYQMDATLGARYRKIGTAGDWPLYRRMKARSGSRLEIETWMARSAQWALPLMEPLKLETKVILIAVAALVVLAVVSGFVWGGRP